MHGLRRWRSLFPFAPRRRTWKAGLAAVLGDLLRVTYRKVVVNERLLETEGDSVRLRVRTKHGGGKRVVLTSEGAEGKFVGRLPQHVLSSGF